MSIRSFVLAALLIGIFVLGAFFASHEASLANRLAGPETSPDDTLTFRRIPATPEVESYYWRPSPDGRKLSFVDWSTGDLALYDVETREVRRVTNKGDWSTSDEFAETNVFSSDGRRIAYAWYGKDKGYAVRVINTDGSGVRVVYPPEHNLRYVVPLAWSPDEAQIFANVSSPTPGEPDKLMLIAVETGAAKVVKELNRGWPYYAAFSPNDRYVAWSEPGPDFRPGEVHVFDLKEEREFRAAAHPAHDAFLTWNDRGSILFHSDRSGTPSIWSVSLDDNGQTAAPMILRKDVWGVEPLGRAGERFFYAVTIEQPRLHTATLDVAAGRLLAPPRAVGPVRQATFAWSPDGQYLAFVTRDVREGDRLMIRPADSSETRELPLPGIHSVRSIHWMPDSRSILFEQRLSTGNSQLYRIDITSGDVVTIGEGPAPAADAHSSLGQLSVDGRRHYRRIGNALVENVIGTNETRVVHESQRQLHGRVALFPDGKMLAVISEREGGGTTMLLVPIDGGPVKTVGRLSDPDRIFHQTTPAVTRDGRYILFVENLLDAPLAEMQGSVMALSIEDGSTRRIFTQPSLRWFSLHPDAGRIAFSGGRYRGELWVMENISGL